MAKRSYSFIYLCSCCNVCLGRSQLEELRAFENIRIKNVNLERFLPLRAKPVRCQWYLRTVALVSRIGSGWILVASRSLWTMLCSSSPPATGGEAAAVLSKKHHGSLPSCGCGSGMSTSSHMHPEEERRAEQLGQLEVHFWEQKSTFLTSDKFFTNLAQSTPAS